MNFADIARGGAGRNSIAKMDELAVPDHVQAAVKRWLASIFVNRYGGRGSFKESGCYGYHMLYEHFRQMPREEATKDTLDLALPESEPSTTLVPSNAEEGARIHTLDLVLVDSESSTSSTEMVSCNTDRALFVPTMPNRFIREFSMTTYRLPFQNRNEDLIIQAAGPGGDVDLFSIGDLLYCRDHEKEKLKIGEQDVPIDEVNSFMLGDYSVFPYADFSRKFENLFNFYGHKRGHIIANESEAYFFWCNRCTVAQRIELEDGFQLNVAIAHGIEGHHSVEAQYNSAGVLQSINGVYMGLLGCVSVYHWSPANGFAGIYFFPEVSIEVLFDKHSGRQEIATISQVGEEISYSRCIKSDIRKHFEDQMNDDIAILEDAKAFMDEVASMRLRRDASIKNDLPNQPLS